MTSTASPPTTPARTRRRVAIAVALLLALGAGYVERDALRQVLGEPQDVPLAPQSLSLSPKRPWSASTPGAAASGAEPVLPGQPSGDASPSASTTLAAPAAPEDTAPPSATAASVPSPPAVLTARVEAMPIAAQVGAPTAIAPSASVAPDLVPPSLDDRFAKPQAAASAPRFAPTGPLVFTPPQLSLPDSGSGAPGVAGSTPRGPGGLPSGPAVQPTMTPQPSSEFQGTWSGTYEGVDQGTLTVRINAKGVVEGSGLSTQFNVRFPLFGAVRGDGDLHVGRPAVGLAAFGVRFTGALVEGSGQGAWTSGAPLNASGTWQMRRD